MPDNNNDTIPPVRRDPEMEAAARRDWLRVHPYAGATETLPAIPRRANMATGETAIRETPPLPPAEQPNYLPDIPRAPMTLSEQMAQRRGQLYSEINAPPKPTRMGRFLHGLNVVGQDIAQAESPQAMQNIPGTFANKRAEYERLGQEQGVEQEREARGQREKEQTALEGRRLGIEEQKLGMLERLPGVERYNPDDPSQLQYGYSRPGQTGTEWHNADEPLKREEPLPGAAAAVPGAILSGTRNAPSPPPPQTPGTISPVAPQQWTYGKPTAADEPLRPQEIAQRNAEARSFWERNNPGKPMPASYQLPPGSKRKDADAMDTMMNRDQTQFGIEASRADTAQRGKEALAIQKENAKIREQEEAGKWLYAVDKNGKTNYVTRGDYDSRPHDFQPNPGTLPPGSVQKAQDHNTILNEMQGRMNAAAEAAQNFNWADGGQQSLAIQAMQNVEKNYPDQVLGVPIVAWVAHNLKSLGLQGATPETRQWIVNLLGLREAMLGMPKEITGGSRQIQSSIEALYATLPGGETPDLDYAMRQMHVAQGTMDRLRGSRVPIVAGFNTVSKLPLLYEHEFTSPKSGKKFYTDDKKEWVDENGRPVQGSPR